MSDGIQAAASVQPFEGAISVQPSEKFTSLTPIKAGELHQSLFKVSDQAADENPSALASQLDFSVSVDPQDGISTHTRIVQLLEINLAFVDHIEQRFSSQFDELCFHFRDLLNRGAAYRCD
jgi:hypothetical protein